MASRPQTKRFTDKQATLRNKGQAILPYYCNRGDFKSTSSLSSVVPRKNLLVHPVSSFDNVSKTNEDTFHSNEKIAGAKSLIVSRLGRNYPSRQWNRPLHSSTRSDVNFNSQPPTPETSISQIDTNGRSSFITDVGKFRSIDDDDNEAEISAPNTADQNHRRYNCTNPSEESVRLLPEVQQHDDNKTDELQQASTEVSLLSRSIDPLQPLSTSQAKSKWNKIRSTVKMASAFSSTSRKKGTLEREDSFLKRFSTRQGGGLKDVSGNDSFAGRTRSPSEIRNVAAQAYGFKSEPPKHPFVLGPNDTFMYVWLFVVTATILYNLWTCIAREAFSELHSSHTGIWIAADLTCDIVYLLDILVQFRTGFLEHGLIVYKSDKLCRHYIKSKDFILDLVSLFPLDLLQFRLGIHPLLRFPRFLKAYRLLRFVYMVETRTVYPNMWRVANLSHTVFLGCHWFAAFYFLISKQENFATSWGYPEPRDELASVTQKYLRSLYWSTLTLTTIGDMPSPETSWEFVFTIISYLIGVFVFATIVGQVGNVITNRNASRQEFERHLDGAKAYMSNHNVPADMQKRVQRWYDYAWNRGRMNGGGDINSLGLLPDKLKTELALHVNLETLRKVTIFHECEPEFLHDLVLKMKAFIFTPGDLICRKGEVAREMFIIADGLIEVVSDSGDILKQMSDGDFFGEIGILNLDGVNKRTADVRSVGYSELFVLSRDDVLRAFKDHPDAEKLIKEYGRQRLQELDDHKKKKMSAYLARKIKEKASSGELKNLLSIDLTPTSGSVGLLGNCSGSTPVATTGDKWLSLTANLLKQARSNAPDNKGASAEKTSDVTASNGEGIVLVPEKKRSDQDVSNSKTSDQTSQSIVSRPKHLLRFSNWKTAWKERQRDNKLDEVAKASNVSSGTSTSLATISSSSLATSSLATATTTTTISENISPSPCLLPRNESNLNMNKNTSTNMDFGHQIYKSTISTQLPPTNLNLASVSSAVHRPVSGGHCQIRPSRPFLVQAPSDVSGSIPACFTPRTSHEQPHQHALATTSTLPRDIDDVIDQDEFSSLCHDVARVMRDVWCKKFVDRKLRKYEDEIMRLEEENRRQQELIGRLMDQLKLSRD